jgi:hypothetical protein
LYPARLQKGGCGKTTSPTRLLKRAPACFSLQLAWDFNVSGDQIAGTLGAVDEVVHLSEVGQRLPACTPVW